METISNNTTTTKKFLWKDKSGRGFTGKTTLNDILESEDEDGYGDSLHEWAENAEPGDEWESRTEKYICIED